MRKLRRFEQIALLDEAQPVRDVVVDRAFPFAEGIAAGDAASRLLRGALGVVLRVDLAKRAQALLDRELLRVAARDVEKLQVLVAPCHAARRRFSISESIAAAFGFTTQNLPRKARKSFRISVAPDAAGFAHVQLDQVPQVLQVRLHALRRDAVDVDQLVVVAIDEAAIQVEHVRETAR